MDLGHLVRDPPVYMLAVGVQTTSRLAAQRIDVHCVGQQCRYGVRV